MPEPVIEPFHGSYLMPSFDHATVTDAMHPGIRSCPGDTSLTDVARLMATHHVHCIAVRTRAHGDAGEPFVWGIITDLDLIRARTRLSYEEAAGGLAQQPVISVKPTTPLREASELMLENGVSHLLVVDPERLTPVGILSTFDIAGVLAWGEA